MKLTKWTIRCLALCVLTNVALMSYALWIWQQPNMSRSTILNKYGNSDRMKNIDAGQYLGCEDLIHIKNLTFIASGWTKAVYSGIYFAEPIALKVVHTSGYDMTACLESGGANVSVKMCYERSSKKLLREIDLLHRLSHPNIVKIYGWCIPNTEFDPGPPPRGQVVLITEPGDQLSTIQLLQMGFEDRLKIVLDLAQLMYYLSKTTLGSIKLADFRRQQFVVISSTLKLTDVDDFIIGDPVCITDKHCIDRGTDQQPLFSVPCVNHTCVGQNSRHNTIVAYKQFLKLLLPYGAPKPLMTRGQELVDLAASGRLDAQALFHLSQELVQTYAIGGYLLPNQRHYLDGYTIHEGITSDMSDISCAQTVASGCVLSVSSEVEAAILCNALPDCGAFIITSTKTWTSRHIALFLTNTINTKVGTNSTLYVQKKTSQNIDLSSNG